MIENMHRQIKAGLRPHWWRLLVLSSTFMLLTACSTVQAAAPTSVPVRSTAEAADAQLFLAQVITPSVTSSSLYLPLVTVFPQLATRMGVAELTKSIDSYPEFLTARTGWYLDWKATLNPPRPNGMEYAQMIRVHQNLECPIGTSPNRLTCPYSVPHSYTYQPNAATIAKIIAANPASLWIIGNEMDRMDWYGSHQDEMLPELYAVAYHELYNLVKTADPSARVAIGGVVQPTPLRLEYLTKVWDTYQALYGEVMPVDVWNTHAFILREKLNEWGASIPPGSLATVGEHDYGPLPHPQHVDMIIFDKQIRAFRQWMKDHGQQDKPLIVTEFGVLYHNWMLGVPDEDSQMVIDFMKNTFDYFLHTTDCNLGYALDDCRLVQRWVWFSMDYKVDFNKHHFLFDPDNLTITATGNAFRDFSLNNLPALNKRPY